MRRAEVARRGGVAPRVAAHLRAARRVAARGQFAARSSAIGVAPASLGGPGWSVSLLMIVSDHEAVLVAVIVVAAGVLAVLGAKLVRERHPA